MTVTKQNLQPASRPRLSEEGGGEAVGRGKLEQIRQKVSHRMVLNTCLSFLNEVMASEPLFEEQSDAVKVSETLYPTNGSGKNLAKNMALFLGAWTNDTKGGIYDKIKLVSFSFKKTSLHKK